MKHMYFLITILILYALGVHMMTEAIKELIQTIDLERTQNTSKVLPE